MTHKACKTSLQFSFFFFTEMNICSINITTDTLTIRGARDKKGNN